MAVKTQGTGFWAMVPETGELIDVGCVTAIDGIDTTLDQIETSCLSQLVRTYEAGMATPGTASFTIYTDPQDANHIRLHQLQVAGVTLNWAIGFSQKKNGVSVPNEEADAATSGTDSSGDSVFVLPEGRAWIVFEGFMNAFPFSFAQNSVVQSNVGIQVSGEPQLIPADTQS